MAAGETFVPPPSDDDRGQPRLVRIEAEGESVGAAKWAAMKELERAHPGLGVEHVSFEVLEEHQREGGYGRVAATADLDAWRASERRFEWPQEPAERAREIVRRTVVYLGLRASVDVEQDADV